MAAEPLAAGREIMSPVDAGPDHRQADIEFRHLRYFAVVPKQHLSDVKHYSFDHSDVLN
jgi:hypothetical protein